MEIRTELEINKSAAEAWTVIGERFGAISEWAGSVLASSIDAPPGVGATRTCHIAAVGPVGAGVVKERLSTFDPPARLLAYEAVDGMPSFITTAISRWSVQPRGAASCVVRIHASFRLRPIMWPFVPFMRRRLTRDMSVVLDELRHRVEAGEPHPQVRAAATGGHAPA